MINFNSNSVFNLTPIPANGVVEEVKGLMIDGEVVIAAFKTVRDQLVFTNKRIITIDVQGITGKRKSFSTLPYSKIQFFTVQTPGFMELFSDNELFIHFSNGFTAKFEFRGKVNISEIGKSISRYVLEND